MITWATEQRKISDLIPASYNPREMSVEQVRDLSLSLERFNLADPIIINTNNTVIGGHMRINVLKSKGGIDELVDVRVPSRELTVEEEKELNLRLNKNLGQWDWEQLANFDEEFLRMVGFTDEEMAENFGLNDAEKIDVDPDRLNVITVEPPEAPRIKAGQTFHFENKEDFDRCVAFFMNGKPGKLDHAKLLDLTR